MLAGQPRGPPRCSLRWQHPQHSGNLRSPHPQWLQACLQIQMQKHRPSQSCSHPLPPTYYLRARQQPWFRGAVVKPQRPHTHQAQHPSPHPRRKRPHRRQPHLLLLQYHRHMPRRLLLHQLLLSRCPIHRSLHQLLQSRCPSRHIQTGQLSRAHTGWRQRPLRPPRHLPLPSHQQRHHHRRWLQPWHLHLQLLPSPKQRRLRRQHRPHRPRLPPSQQPQRRALQQQRLGRRRPNQPKQRNQLLLRPMLQRHQWEGQPSRGPSRPRGPAPRPTDHCHLRALHPRGQRMTRGCCLTRPAAPPPRCCARAR